MTEVTPINRNTIALHEQDILQLISQIKWAHISKNSSQPRYLIIGGNYWLRLQDRMRRISCYAGLASLIGTLTQIQGLEIVIVKRDALECGE